MADRRGTVIRVSAAVIEQGGRILIARRRKDDPLSGKWEFPGGKIEPGETPQECLRRELMEELLIDAHIGEFFCSTSHDYGTFSVDLLFYHVNSFQGVPEARDHAEILWVRRSELSGFDFPDADRAVIAILQDTEYRPDR